MANGTPGRASVDGGARQDISGALTNVIVRYVRARAGDDGVAEMLSMAHEARPVSALEDPTSWSSHDEAIALFDAAAEITGDPQVGLHVGEEMLRQHDGTEVANLLRSLGSPGELLRNVAAAAAKFSTVSTMEPLEVANAHAVVRAITRPGFLRYPQLCDFTKGLLSQVPVLFGLVPAVVTEPECQAKGGRFCLYSVAWEAGQWSALVDERSSLSTMAWGDEGVVEARSEIELDERARIAALESQVSQLTKRLEGVYSTAADLVATDHIDEVLSRITARAAHAVNAPRYLLVVQTSPEAPVRLHHHGFTAAEAKALAHELLEEHPDDRLGSRLIVDIASRRHYGRLAAVYPDGMQFFAEEQRTLAVYADYAATALDVVTTLDEARRSNATASALLDFSRALSGVGTVDRVVRQLAETVPVVAGSERSTVLLWDPTAETLAVRASTLAAAGAPRAEDAGGRVVHRSQTPFVDHMLESRQILVIDQATTDPFLQRVLIGTGTAASVVVPLYAGDEFLGVVTADYEHRMDHGLRTDRDLHERLTGLADQAVTALQNARLHEKISHMAWHDALTGLPNRRLLEDRVDQQLHRARRTGESTCLFFVDLDRFKSVNDTLGHGAGDELVQQVARRLVETVRRQDTVARLGGDEFAVLLPGLSDPDALSQLARRALEALEQPYVVAGRELQITGSIGAAIAPLHGESYHELMMNADAAMYRSKAQGRNTFRVFEAEGSDTDAGAAQLEADLHRALDARELFVVYQPFIDLQTQGVVGVEALARWRHPTRGILGPAAFIPLAERSDLIVRIDSWVVGEACAQVRRWADAGMPLMRVAVNATVRDLGSDRFVDAVVDALAGAGLDPGALELEVAEDVVMADRDTTGHNVDRLRQLGVRFSIDHYGSGSSGLNRIGSFPVSTLKIDQSFVQVLGPADESATLVSAIISLAKSLGIEAVAEGVETVHQSRILLQRGCRTAQGFLFSPPLAPDEVARLLRGAAGPGTGAGRGWGGAPDPRAPVPAPLPPPPAAPPAPPLPPPPPVPPPPPPAG
jgi:diguanylate cyclase (GGDEF)-like protein